jgi:hypothetical protein
MVFTALISDRTRFSVEAKTVAEAEKAVRARLEDEGKAVDRIRFAGTRLAVHLTATGEGG